MSTRARLRQSSPPPRRRENQAKILVSAHEVTLRFFCEGQTRTRTSPYDDRRSGETMEYQVAENPTTKQEFALNIEVGARDTRRFLGSLVAAFSLFFFAR